MLVRFMDNLCHTLAGAAMGEAGLKRRTRFGHAALMISANVPDIDVLVFVTDASSLAVRRGWTHGVAAQLVLPAAVAAGLWALARVRPARPHAPPLRLGWLLLLAYAGLYSHVLLDYLNNYGVRLLTPLDWRWFYGDSVFIIDLWLWLILGLGIWLSRRRTAVRPARWALMLAVCYIAAMVVSTRAARVIVADAWRARAGAEPRALMVGPRAITPLTRDVIVDAGDRYQAGSFDWRTREVQWDPIAIPKNDHLPEVASARANPAVRGFLVWSRFPYWEVERTADGSRVVLRDMRFMAVGRGFQVDAIVE